MNAISSLANWQFLDEPAYRWFIFVGVMALFLFAWGGVIRHM